MRWGISNGGRSARALGDDLPLEAGEVLFVGDLPRNPFDEYDTGLVIDAGVARARTESEWVFAAKAARIAAHRAEARRRIEAKWPDPIQRSASLGVYPAEKIDQMKLDIAAVIEAENTAADQIDAATTITEAEAVTVAWPVI